MTAASTPFSRPSGRAPDELRPVRITRGFTNHAEGSVLIEFGATRVLCTASVEAKVPGFLRGKGEGWVTAEYGMLPRATHTRGSREAAKGKQSGRTQEIQRLIGRALRSVVDLSLLGEKTIWFDCDVLQADGGTRTAAISGSFVALVDAVDRFYADTNKAFPVRDFLAATSIGLVGDEVLLDLCYEEDSRAAVDMNLVMTGSGKLVEVQGTGESHPFSKAQFQEMMVLGEVGCQQIIELQKSVLGPLTWRVGREP